jgi:photosystem II stability/assembly factor-like uncharacterized protein
MKLLTPTTGWVSRFNHLYWTTDSGSNWADINPIPPGVIRAGVALQGVFFLNTHEGWATVYLPGKPVSLVPQPGHPQNTLYDVAHTVNSGKTWSFTAFTYPKLSYDEEEAIGGLDDMFFLDHLHGWLDVAMTGSSNFAPGVLLATSDGGRNWKRIKGPGTIGALFFTSIQDGWLAGGPGGEHLYVTRDGCKSWQEVNLAPPAEAGPVAFRVLEGPPIFSSDVRGFVAASYAGHEGEGSKLIVFSTGDGGARWKPIKILPEPGYGGGAPVGALVTDSVLLAPTGKQKVGVTAVPLSGALTSSTVVSFNNVLGMSFAGRSYGLAWAMSGGISFTSDGGATWKNVTPWHNYMPVSSSPRPIAPANQMK